MRTMSACCRTVSLKSLAVVMGDAPIVRDEGEPWLCGKRGAMVEISLNLPARHGFQLRFYHFVKRPQIVAFTGSEAAVNFHGRKKLGAGHGECQRGELLSGIRFNAPVAAKAPTHDFTKVAAPQLAHLGQF